MTIFREHTEFYAFIKIYLVSFFIGFIIVIHFYYRLPRSAQRHHTLTTATRMLSRQ